MTRSSLFSLLCCACIVSAATAQREAQPLPSPVPLPAPTAPPLDKLYPGAVSLTVDITNTVDRVERVHEEIPVVSGSKEMVLLYPEWLPGEHEPAGPIQALAGIVTRVDARRVQWVRDTVDVYAFHVPLTPGAKTVSVDFDYLSAIKPAAGRIEFSDVIADVEWNEVVMYPAGYYSRGIPVDAALKLPAGWKYATALETASQTGDVVHFERTPLNTFIDSPLYAGTHFERIDLSPTPTDIVHLDIFADTEAELKMTPEQLDVHRRLAVEADKLYGSHHYKHYDFLLLLSDHVGGIGLEHHQSSEDGHRGNFLTEWEKTISERDLLAHEYTHSWNGKFRRPAELWTPNFNVPMRDSLLWVYEGMTQYWGNVLTARSGMRTPEQTRDLFARVAAGYAASPGREWRPLVDTTNQPILSQRHAVSWVSFQRPEDYYSEGELIWLDADTKIRELTRDAKSLDDFCKLFLGVHNGSFVTDQYTLADVVNDLNQVVAYDWKKILNERVYELHPEVPMNGFIQGGYQLVYSDSRPAWLAKQEEDSGYLDMSTSLGFSLGQARGGVSKSVISNVWWNSPAYKAGVTPNMELLAINGQAFKAEVLNEAVLQAEKDKKPIQLQVKDGDAYETLPVPYYDGLRYPSLERLQGTPNRLDEILQPSKSALPDM